jgi:hypothetical protein
MIEKNNFNRFDVYGGAQFAPQVMRGSFRKPGLKPFGLHQKKKNKREQAYRQQGEAQGFQNYSNGFFQMTRLTGSGKLLN